MPVRQKVVARHADGRTLVMLRGDPLPWKHDLKAETFWVDVGDAQYAVQRTRPEGLDSRGHKLFRYWAARAKIDGKVFSLGDEHMIAQEGMDVCEIYESARHMPGSVNSQSKDKQIDDTRGASEDQHPASAGRIRRLLPYAGADGVRGRRT